MLIIESNLSVLSSPQLVELQSEAPFDFRTTPEQKRRRAEARRKGLVAEWRGEIRPPLYKNTREGKREAFQRRPIVEPAQPEQGPAKFDCSEEAFQARQKRLAEERGSSSYNPLLNFLPIARRLLSQSELEYAINQRPCGDFRIGLSRKGRLPSRPNQQDQQQEQEDNEFDGIQLLWTENDSVIKLATTQPSEQLKNIH